jgi:hypothetical protein
MNTVFISYRRQTAAGEARALFNDLVMRLGKGSVFMDVDSIALGRDFRRELEKTLASCDLMLVLIDREWTDIKDEAGRTRLNNPADFVRLEIETALRRDIIVTPVLVNGAHMPDAEQLPAEIKDLAYRNAFELSHNRWESDVEEMIKRLGLAAQGAKTQVETNRPAVGFVSRKKHWAFWTPIAACIIIALSIAAYSNSARISDLFKSDTPAKIDEPSQPAASSHDTTSGASEAFGVSNYVGGWTNADPKTRGIHRISVRNDNDKLMVQAWGRCHPTDCDWGAIPATFFRSNVEAATDGPIKSVSATFKSGFSETYLSLRLISRDKLMATDTTHFTDKSGRADYENTEEFVRAGTNF